MQVVIRMQDVDLLTEVIDAVEGQSGFSPNMETTEAEWCVASYQVDEGAVQAGVLVHTILDQLEAHGLMTETDDDNTPVEVKIS